MKGLKKRILTYMMSLYDYDPKFWEHGGSLEEMASKAGFKASTGSRRCRELAQDGKLECKKNEKGHVLYRYSPINLYAST